MTTNNEMIYAKRHWYLRDEEEDTTEMEDFQSKCHKAIQLEENSQVSLVEEASYKWPQSDQ